MMDIDITVGCANVRLEPPMTTLSGHEVVPNQTVTDLIAAVLAALRAVGSTEADELAQYIGAR